MCRKIGTVGVILSKNKIILSEETNAFAQELDLLFSKMKFVVSWLYKLKNAIGWVVDE